MVMAGSASLATTVTIYKKLPYDPTKDFAPLALITRIPFVLVVNPSLPVNSVADLIKTAKQDPGKLSYASGGPGSPHHLFMELLKSMTGIQMLHVPYKGTAPAISDVVAGHIPVMLGDVVGVAAAGQGRQGAGAGRDVGHENSIGARYPDHRGIGRPRLRRRRLGDVRGAGPHAQADRR